METNFVTADEYNHPPTNEPQFNESAYFNFVDSTSEYATLIRMGNRVNEGHAEATVLVYLPGGAAALHFGRPTITTNDVFDAGGLRFDVIEPLQRMRCVYEGEANVLASGLDLADPKTALTTSPIEPVHIDLEYENLIPVYGLSGGQSGIAGGEDTIATGHYQVPCRVVGTVSVGDRTIDVNGLGFRDHSWGPRKWQGPTYWRWVSCLCDDKNGFVGWLNRVGDNRPPGNGMVLRDGKFSLVRRVEVTSQYGPAPYYPESMEIDLHTDDRVYHASGRVRACVPLRNRRDGVVARLAEVVNTYDFDGMEGHGIAEYHDIMLDGVPAGMHEV
jgi:hypothetical protein